MPKKKHVVVPLQEGVCLFCGREDEDNLWCGKLFTDKESGLTIHYYCLLFASGLSQHGQDNEGIQGFLVQDIKQEFRRGSRLNCNYCVKKGATIGCVVPSCKVKFHFPCGRENQSLSQFFGHFNSYCQDHRPQQETTSRVKKKTKCPICLTGIDAKTAYLDALKTPCCKNTWIHRACVQQQALSAGFYFFRCAICNDKDLFQQEMLQFGIYIPEQDASWELETNAFVDLLERYSKCDVSNCICPDGRQYSKTRGNWEIFVCCTCGSSGAHAKCVGLKNNPSSSPWECMDCRATLQNDNAGRNNTPIPKARPPVMLRLANSRFNTPVQFMRSPATSRAITLSPPTPGTDEIIEITELPQVLTSPALSYKSSNPNSVSKDGNTSDADEDEDVNCDDDCDDNMPKLTVCMIRKLRSQKNLFNSESCEDENVTGCWSTDTDFDSQPPKLTIMENGSAVKAKSSVIQTKLEQHQLPSPSCSAEKAETRMANKSIKSPQAQTKHTPSRRVLFSDEQQSEKSDVTTDVQQKEDKAPDESKILQHHSKSPKSCRKVEGSAIKKTRANGPEVICLSSSSEETDEENLTQDQTTPLNSTPNNNIPVNEKKFVKSTTRMSMKAKPYKLKTDAKHKDYFTNFFKKQNESRVESGKGENDSASDDIIITKCELSKARRKQLKRKYCCHHKRPHKKFKKDKCKEVNCNSTEVITVI